MITLRPVIEDDEAFLRRVYRSTREPELDLTGWEEEQKAAFVNMQFDAQDRHYRQQHPGASFDVVLLDGERAGRLYVNRAPGDLRIIDIALLPAFRNRGIGSSLLRDILDEAAVTGSAVTIHVEQFNPARRLYDRLGFRPLAEDAVYVLMEWRMGAEVVS